MLPFCEGPDGGDGGPVRVLEIVAPCCNLDTDGLYPTAPFIGVAAGPASRPGIPLAAAAI